MDENRLTLSKPSQNRYSVEAVELYAFEVWRCVASMAGNWMVATGGAAAIAIAAGSAAMAGPVGWIVFGAWAFASTGGILVGASNHC